MIPIQTRVCRGHYQQDNDNNYQRNSGMRGNYQQEDYEDEDYDQGANYGQQGSYSEPGYQNDFEGAAHHGVEEEGSAAAMASNLHNADKAVTAIAVIAIVIKIRKRLGQQ